MTLAGRGRGADGLVINQDNRARTARTTQEPSHKIFSEVAEHRERVDHMEDHSSSPHEWAFLNHSAASSRSLIEMISSLPSISGTKPIRSSVSISWS